MLPFDIDIYTQCEIITTNTLINIPITSHALRFQAELFTGTKEGNFLGGRRQF